LHRIPCPHALGRHVSPEAEAFRHRPFALGDAEALWALVVGAGFRDVVIRPVVKVLRFPSAEAFVQRYSAGAGALAQMVAQVDDHARAALLREVSAAVHAYVDADGLAMPKASQQHLQSMRRNTLPMERINRSLLMLPEDLRRALV
jgi:hypothetical protein